MHARTAERRNCRTAALVVLLGTLLASGAHAGALPPHGKRALLVWLKAGAYASSFTPEPEPHSSTSAHGPFVRTWYSPVLTEDLRAGRVPFRKGAAMVKEVVSRRADCAARGVLRDAQAPVA